MDNRDALVHVRLPFNNRRVGRKWTRSIHNDDNGARNEWCRIDRSGVRNVLCVCSCADTLSVRPICTEAVVVWMSPVTWEFVQVNYLFWFFCFESTGSSCLLQCHSDRVPDETTCVHSEKKCENKNTETKALRKRLSSFTFSRFSYNFFSVLRSRSRWW